MTPFMKIIKRKEFEVLFLPFEILFGGCLKKV